MEQSEPLLKPGGGGCDDGGDGGVGGEEVPGHLLNQFSLNPFPVNPFSESGYQSIKHLLDQEHHAPLFPDSLERMTVVNPHRLNLAPKHQFKQKINSSLATRGGIDGEDRLFLDALASRRDILLLDERPDCSHDRQLQLLAAHVLNSCLLTRDAIVKASAKAAKDAGAEAVRDQGFTRPRFLILVPFKNTAFKLITYMMQLWRCGGDADDDDEGQVEQKKRFLDEYGKIIDVHGEEVAEENLSGRPADFQHVFAGNVDDCFRMGIKTTRKALKLFADFYSADVIIASPLGLKLAMEGQGQWRGDKEGKEGKGGKEGKRGNQQVKGAIIKSPDCDFLSSIESVVVDQADVIAMQNWEHLTEIMGKLNGLPKEAHNCDFSRVMSVFLDNKARRVRQSVFLSAFAFPELAHLFSAHCCNVFGAVKFEPTVQPAGCQLSRIRPEFHFLPQQVEPLAEAASRFDYFRESTVKSLQAFHHVLLFVSNYFEFLQVKEHLEAAEVSFAAISEYSEHKDVCRSRSRFFDGHVRILLLTERFHFYNRRAIRGVKRVVFYSLPAYPVHFQELIDMVSLKSGSVKVAPYIICSVLDVKKMERVFGSKSMQKIHF